MNEHIFVDRSVYLEMVYETIGTPIIIINSGQEIFSFPKNLTVNPLFSSIEEHLNKCVVMDSQIRLLVTDYYERLVCIPYDNALGKGWLLVGPTVFPEPRKNEIGQLLDHLKKNYLITKFEDYLLSLPVIGRNKILQTSNLIYYLLFHEKIDVAHELHTIQDQTIIEKSIKHIRYIDQKRQHSSFHHDPIIERKIYQYIEDGNTDEIVPYFRGFLQRTDFENGLLYKGNNLRNQKNLTIALITLATRAAIRGGLHPEVAYSLGDVFIQEVEFFQTEDKVEKFKEYIIYEFTEKVAKSKTRQYMKRITECQTFIYKHLYDKELNLTKIADHLHLNYKYLSNLFKKEVGISISEYIQKEKINEAKKLIIYEDYSLIKISNLLNFTDQSYFTKIFKKHAKMNPTEFLQMNRKTSNK